MFFVSNLRRRAFFPTLTLRVIGGHKRLGDELSDATPAGAVAGLYVAWHPWLDTAYGPRQLFKVGYSDNLAGRLANSCYVTCFSDEWEYVATFEVRRTEDAKLLERAVLHACSSRIVPNRELVNASPEELVELVKNVASKLALTFRFRLKPKYVLPREEIPESPLKLLFGVKNFVTSKREIVDWTSVSMKLDGLHLPSSSTKRNASSSLSDGTSSSGQTGVLTMLRDISDAADKLTSNDTVIESGNDNAEDVIAAKVIKIASELEEVLPTGPDAVEDIESNEESDVAEAIERVAGVILIPAAGKHQAVELRDYQLTAVSQCMEELEKSKRTSLVMACRCGKTPIAFEIVMRHLNAPQAGADPVACFLVPGLPLLRQTSMKIASYGASCKLLLVGSDKRPVHLPDGQTITMTTDPDTISDFLHKEKGPRLVLSTYQSSPLLPTDAFVLTVFDECHRVCGGGENSPFNYMLLAPQHGNRLFMTATPVYHGPLNMKDFKFFGQTSYRFSLRQGINGGFVNSYKLRIVAGPSTCVDYSDHVITAMKMVNQMLVFCNSVDDCEALVAKLNSAKLPADVEPFVAVTVHSRMKTGSVAQVILMTATTKRLVIVNCRLFQEGVEIPTLNAVFFAAPRVSPREIVQSMCRPLTKLENKPPSYVFLPILHDKTQATYTIPNLKRYAAIVPFAEALLAEDSRLYDAICDPTHAQDFRVVGTKTLHMSNDQLEMFVMPNIWRVMSHTKSMRKKLLRPQYIPWEKGIRELRRIVETCNRYPRSSDAWVVGSEEVNIAAFHRLCVKGYLDATLEVYQRKDLDALPGWVPFGTQGPFPWELCLGYLRDYLIQHNGSPPPVDPRCAYTGLDATRLERIAGIYLLIQLMDAHAVLRMPIAKQRDLDELCGRFGIKWRKQRDPKTNLVTSNQGTLLALSAEAFQAALASDKRTAFLDEHFPGYPQKHAACESVDVMTSGAAPMRKIKKSKASRVQELEYTRTSDMEGKPVYHCKVCSVVLLGDNNWNIHREGKVHRGGLQKLVQSMEDARSRRKAVAFENSAATSVGGISSSEATTAAALDSGNSDDKAEISASEPVNEKQQQDENDEEESINDSEPVQEVPPQSLEDAATADASCPPVDSSETQQSTGDAGSAEDGDLRNNSSPSPPVPSTFTSLTGGILGCNVCGTTFHESFLAAHEASALHSQALAAQKQLQQPRDDSSVSKPEQASSEPLPPGADEHIHRVGPDAYVCKLCESKSMNRNVVSGHTASKLHVKNVARMELIKKMSTGENKEQMKYLTMVGPSSDNMHCACCDQSFHINNLACHIQGGRHQKMIEQLSATYESVVGIAERLIFEKVPSDAPLAENKVRCIPCEKVMSAWEVVAHRTAPGHIMRISTAGTGRIPSAAPTAAMPQDAQTTPQARKESSIPYIEYLEGSTSASCTLCKIVFPDAFVDAHVKSKAHAKQVRLQGGLNDLTPEQRELTEVLQDQSLRCKCCEITFSIDSAATHFAGKTHERNLTRMIFSGTSPAEICSRAGETVIVV